MESLKFIETLDSFGWDDKRYISVDRNAFGEVFIAIKKKPVITDSMDDVRLELERDAAFELAQQILGNLVLYPADQVDRIKLGLDCACNHRKEVFENEEE